MQAWARAAAVVAVVTALGACGGGQAGLTAAASAQCDERDLAGCERRLGDALDAEQVPHALAEAYADARTRVAVDDAWAAIWGALDGAGRGAVLLVRVERAGQPHGAAGDAASATRAPSPAPHQVSLPALPAPAALDPSRLLLALGRAAGVAHIAVVHEGAGGVQHLLVDDPLAPLLPALPADLREAAGPAAPALALAAAVRDALAHASAGRYLEAAHAADALAATLARGDGDGASVLRARFALRALAERGLGALADAAETHDEGALPARAPSTAYEAWLRVELAGDAGNEWTRQREQVLAALPAAERAAIDALHRARDCDAVRPAPPAMNRAAHLRLSERVAEGGGAAAEARYRALIATVDRTRSTWAWAPALLDAPGGAQADAAGEAARRRAAELVSGHVEALRRLQREEPARYRARAHVPLLVASAGGADARLQAALLDLGRVSLRDGMDRAASAEGVLDVAVDALFTGMSYPQAARPAHFLALRDAFTGKLQGDLGRQHGWGVAGLWAADAAVRVALDGPQGAARAASAAEHIAAALDGARPDEDPALAALLTSAARYLALGLAGGMDLGDDPARHPPQRQAARAALETALRGLAAPGEAPAAALVRDVAALGDGLVAAAAQRRAEAAGHGSAVTAAATKPKDPRDDRSICRDAHSASPPLRRSLARLADVRRRILLHPRFARDDGAFGRRLRALTVVLSDALDLLVAGEQRPTFTVEAESAEKALLGGGADLGPQLSAPVAQGYLLLRELWARGDASPLAAGGGARLRALLGGLHAFAAGPAGGRGSLLEALARAPVAGASVEALLGSGARAFHAAGDARRAELLLAASLAIAGLGRSTPGPASIEAAAAQHSRTEWALRFLAEVDAARHGRPPDPGAYAAGLRGLRDDACRRPDAEDMLGAMGAVRDFARGERARAAQALDALLARAEQRGLQVPKVTHRYAESTGNRRWSVSLDVSLGAGFIQGASALGMSLGLRSGRSNEDAFSIELAPPSADADEETARVYVHLAALAATYHFLEGDAARAEVDAARAVAAVAAGVRLGERRIAAAGPRWAADARGTLAVAAQLAAEAGRPFLAGDLWALARGGLPSESDDAEVAAVLHPPPPALAAAIAPPGGGAPTPSGDVEAAVRRAAGSLRTVAAPLACTDAKVEIGGMEESACDRYPLALSLRIADALPWLPRLRPGGVVSRGCPALRAVDRFLAAREARTYDPDALLAAVAALADEGKTYDAAHLLTRQRSATHCSAAVTAAARRLAGLAATDTQRADLLSTAVTCAAAQVDEALQRDLLALDAATRGLADRGRNLKVLLVTVDLALRSRRWEVLDALVGSPAYVERWLDGGAAAATAALVAHHAAGVLRGVPRTPASTQRAFAALCARPAADLATLCAEAAAVRAPGAGAARAEQALKTLVTSAHP